MRKSWIVCLVAACLIALLASVIATAPRRPTRTLDREQITALFEKEILPRLELPSTYIAFLYPRLLDTADVLCPYAPTPLPADVTLLPYPVPLSLRGPTWFVWLDLSPYARYSHPTRFVLIDARDGSFDVYDEAWWPLLNGESLWTELASYWDERNWIGSAGLMGRPHALTPSAVPDGSSPVGGDPFDWALLVNGWSAGEPGEREFAEEVHRVQQALEELGMKVTLLGPPDLTPGALEAEIARLFTEIPLYRCCDRLYLFVVSHASPGTLWIGGRALPASELARLVTFPGTTYVPSRTYLLLDVGYGGSFLPLLSPHGNITRAWTASAADEPAFGDLDPSTDPDPGDSGGEWTSSFLRALEAVISEDALAAASVEVGRYYMAINDAMRRAPSWNAAIQHGVSHPSAYLFSDADPEGLRNCTEYLAGWERQRRINDGTWGETLAQFADDPCEALFWFLYNMARHDALLAPSQDYNGRMGKGCAKDVAHSNWRDLCALFWDVFSRPPADTTP